MEKQLTPEQLASLHVWNRNNAVNSGCAPSLILYALLLVFLLAGCKSTKYITTVEHHTDSVYTQHLRDSIYVHDSTYVEVKGDTTLIERWHTAWRDREVHDTTVVVRIDSIPAPYPVIKDVPAELTWWQQAMMYVGGIVILLLIIFAGWKIYVTLHPRI